MFLIFQLYLYGLKAAKNTHQIKKTLNKSCSKLNFVQNSPQAHMSTFPWSGTRAQKIDMVEILLFGPSCINTYGRTEIPVFRRCVAGMIERTVRIMSIIKK